MGSTDIAAWIAVAGFAIAIGRDIWKAFNRRKIEKSALDKALDTQPFVREQLQLGNTAAAIAPLNVIIEAQGKYIREQEDVIDKRDAEIDSLKVKLIECENSRELG